MKIWSLRKNKTPMLHYFLFAYWFILLVWQNLGAGGSANRGGMDVVIKCGLLVMLMIYYFMHATGIRRDILLMCMLLVGVYAIVKIEGGLDLSKILYYFFPFLFVLLIFGVGWKFELNKRQLVHLCNMLIVVVSYIAVYALIFCTDQFANAFSIDNAYSNELKSFLMSSHEYGMYLVFGIMAIILCMEFDPEGTKNRRFWYFLALILFSVNLILTFSRTSILSLAVLLIFYVLIFAKKRLRNWFLILAGIAVLMVLVIPSLRNFFWEIVMKENNDAGRDALIDFGMAFYRDGSVSQKLFGWDYAPIKAYLASSRGLGSFHNAYVQQIVANGLLGVFIMIMYSVVTLYDIFRTIKTKKEGSHLSKFFISFAASAVVFMTFNTAALFASAIDSYFMTLFTVVVPKYVNQSIRAGTFDVPIKNRETRPNVRRVYR